MTARRNALLCAVLASSACDIGSCSKYASEYSCNYVENDAEYEVWYWRNVSDDNENENRLIGRARGLRMCEDNARTYASLTGGQFTHRSYSCVLMKDGRRMERHRLYN